MIFIDPKDTRAIYEQVFDKLSDLMLIGALKSGDKLPSVRNLAIELSINPNTIQRAYIELEREGYIYSVKGVGSFVADYENIQNAKKIQVLQEIKDLINKVKKVMSKEELFAEITKLYIEEGGLIHDRSKELT